MGIAVLDNAIRTKHSLSVKIHQYIVGKLPAVRFEFRYLGSFLFHRFIRRRVFGPSLLPEITPTPEEIGMTTATRTGFSDDLSQWRIQTVDNSILRNIEDILHRSTSPVMRDFGAHSYISFLFENREVSPVCVIDYYAWQFNDIMAAEKWWRSFLKTVKCETLRTDGDVLQVRCHTIDTVHARMGAFYFKATYMNETPPRELLISALEARVGSVSSRATNPPV